MWYVPYSHLSPLPHVFIHSRTFQESGLFVLLVAISFNYCVDSRSFYFTGRFVLLFCVSLCGRGLGTSRFGARHDRDVGMEWAGMGIGEERDENVGKCRENRAFIVLLEIPINPQVSLTKPSEIPNFTNMKIPKSLAFSAKCWYSWAARIPSLSLAFPNTNFHRD